MKKILITILLALSIASTAYAIPVTVPSAPSLGSMLYGLANGLYTTLTIGAEGTCLGVSGGLPAFITCATSGGVGTSTNPFMATYFVATSTTATSTFPNLNATQALTINNYKVATSTVVCKTGATCQYSTIQSAINAGATNIFVKDGTYSEQLTFSQTKTRIVAESLRAIIQCNGSTQSPCISPTDESEMIGFTINETNGALLGTAWDASNHSRTKFVDNRVNNFSTSTLFNDTSSLTFYNEVRGNTFFNVRTCYEFSGTQSNANWVTNNRCRPALGAGGYGAFVSDARGLFFSGGDIEGPAGEASGTSTGMYFDAASRDNLVTGGWIEALGTGINIATGANNIKIDGTTVSSHGTDITDNGTNTTLSAVNRTGTKLNQMMPFTVPSTSGTSYILGTLGIGTSSPYAKLSVVGQIVGAYFTGTTTATSTFAGGITSPCFSTDGTNCITSGGTASSDSRWATSTDTTSIYPTTATKVGIGTTTPKVQLDVSTSTTSTTNDAIRITNLQASSGARPGLSWYDGTSAGVFSSARLSSKIGTSRADSAFYIEVADSGKVLRDRLTIDVSGNTGIGTSSPYAKLSVVGQAVAEYFTATSTTATSTFAGAVGIGTTSPAYANLSNSGLTLGLNKNIVLTTDRTTNNFKGNIIFKNEGASTTKSGLEWFGFGTTTSSAWIVWHQSLNGELDGSHGAPHLEIETADLAGQKQGRWTVQSECDYDCIQTFNQSEIYITRNSGQTNGNLLFNGGGQLRNTGGMQVIPNNAINTKGFRIATSTDNDIAIDVTSGTELEILDNVAVTGTGSFTSYVSIGTTTVDSAISQLTIGKSGASGTTLGATLDLRQTQTAINDTSNSVLGKILFTGNDKFTGEDGIGAEIRGTATGIWNGTTNDYPTSLSFLTTPNGAGALAEIMRITDTGNVGIGTTSPYAKLSVVGEAVAENFTSTSTAINTFPNLSATNATSTNLFSTTASTTDQYVGGLMGMGTSTPAARLEISHRETTPAISIDAGASGNDVFRIFRGTAGGSSGLGMALTVSNANPQFSFRANMSSMSSGVARNSILYDATNASLTISTSTVATGTTGVEPFVIKNSTGNIGLGGTSTPWAVVSVTGRFQSAGTPTFVVASSSKVDLIVMQSGNVGVATTSPWTKFGVTGTVAMSGLTTSAGTPNALCINASTKEVTENAASSCLVSDEDQKTPLKPLNIDALSMIRDMQPSSFSYKDNLKRLRYGFGAQSLQKIDNQLGDAFDKDGVARSIDIPAILAVNTAAIQELDEKIGGGMATAKKTAQDNWQWALIGLLALGMGYQQYQISKLKK